MELVNHGPVFARLVEEEGKRQLCLRALPFYQRRPLVVAAVAGAIGLVIGLRIGGRR